MLQLLKTVLFVSIFFTLLVVCHFCLFILLYWEAHKKSPIEMIMAQKIKHDF